MPPTTGEAGRESRRGCRHGRHGLPVWLVFTPDANPLEVNEYEARRLNGGGTNGVRPYDPQMAGGRLRLAIIVRRRRNRQSEVQSRRTRTGRQSDGIIWQHLPKLR